MTFYSYMNEHLTSSHVLVRFTYWKESFLFNFWENRFDFRFVIGKIWWDLSHSVNEENWSEVQLNSVWFPMTVKRMIQSSLLLKK